MDPITIIVTALAAGAAAGLKPTAEQAIKDAYAGVKALIQRRYNTAVQLAVQSLEQKPDSEIKQKSTAEDLAGAGATADKELLEKAMSLLGTVEEHDRATAARLNINFQEIKATYIRIVGASATGDVNVEVGNADITEGIDIEGIHAGKK